MVVIFFISFIFDFVLGECGQALQVLFSLALSLRSPLLFLIVYYIRSPDLSTLFFDFLRKIFINPLKHIAKRKEANSDDDKNDGDCFHVLLSPLLSDDTIINDLLDYVNDFVFLLFVIIM